MTLCKINLVAGDSLRRTRFLMLWNHFVSWLLVEDVKLAIPVMIFICVRLFGVCVVVGVVVVGGDIFI